MKPVVVLVQLLFAGILLFSCNKSEVIDNSLPIRLELPLCRYIRSLDSTDKENRYYLLSNDAIVIQSEVDLEDCLHDIENLYDKDFREKYPEYASVDFSKFTMIVRCFLGPYQPQNFISAKSYFYSRENVSDQYKSDDYSYYYFQYRNYYSESTVSDEKRPIIYISGIVVDKIPANEKVMSVVSFGVTVPGE